MVDCLHQGDTNGRYPCAADSGTETSDIEERSQDDADEQCSDNAEDRCGTVTLRRRAVWREPLKDEGLTSGYRHVTCGPTRRRPSPRAAASWDVLVPRGPRGLGFSIEHATPPWPGHVSVKSVFPHEPAATSGRVSAGDILLRVNEMPVHGLSVQEVLHVLRRAGSQVLLSLARAAEETTPEDPESSSGGTDVSRSSSRNTLLSIDSDPGTFEVELTKVNQSLGLSLRRSNDTALGHDIRAKVREPALSDPRIRAGDKVIQVNGVDTRWMSHAELVSYLRRCPDTVRLTIYRDGQATPASPGSPVATRAATLRPEALQMLCGLALQRELRRPSSDAGGSVLQRRQTSEEKQRRKSGERPRRKLSRPSAALIRAVSGPDGTDKSWQLPAEDNFTDFRPVEDHHCDSSTTQRPAMDVTSLQHKESGSVVSEGATSEDCMVSEGSGGYPTSEASAGYIVHSEGSMEAESDGFWGSDDSDAELHERHLRRVTGQEDPGGLGRRKQPYLSVQPQQRTKPNVELKRISSEERLTAASTAAEVGGDLLKWKGFTLDSGEGKTDAADSHSFVVQLRRGWSARLGFSLHSVDGGHVVTQIHPDSVAERDGRLRVGDLLLKVNSEPVSDLTSDQVIDLLRKSGGAVTLTLVRL